MRNQSTHQVYHQLENINLCKVHYKSNVLWPQNKEVVTD